MCCAQGHNAVTPVRLDPATLPSRVKHFITEPLCSHTTSSWRTASNTIGLDINKIFERKIQLVFNKFLFSSYFSSDTYVVGTLKNRLNETVLLSTQNICYN